VPFRAESFGHAAAFIQAMAGGGSGDGVRFSASLYVDHAVVLALIAGVIGSMPVLPWARRWWESRLAEPAGARTTVWLVGGEVARLVLLATVFLASAMQLASATHNPFIYFRF